jgi:aldose sugar dehydrogenase
MESGRASPAQPNLGTSGAALSLAGLLILSACSTSEGALLQNPAVQTHEYTFTEVVRGLKRPWALAFLPEGDILVTQRGGEIRLVRQGRLEAMPVAGGPEVQAGGQGGLLDLTLHPDFSSNGLIYFSYSKALEGGLTTAVARARWDGEALRELEDIFVADAAGGEGRHFGSRLLFDRERRLWVTVGDRGLGDPSQDLSNHMGTTLRLHDDGSVPADNPFVGEDGARPEIYSYGHRNAQGLALHPGTGEVWLHEHGPRGGDAVQRVLAGRNYGWPEVSFGREYTFLPIPDPEPGQGFELPLHHWTPSIAPSGMTFYIGSRFPAWRGDVFAGALAGRHLRRVVFDGLEPIHEEVLLEELGERIRDVRTGPDGYLYILTDSDDGVLGRLEPAGSD